MSQLLAVMTYRYHTSCTWPNLALIGLPQAGCHKAGGHTGAEAVDALATARGSGTPAASESVWAGFVFALLAGSRKAGAAVAVIAGQWAASMLMLTGGSEPQQPSAVAPER